MVNVIRGHVDALGTELIADRRDFHKHAESGWTEFRTASLVARRLSDLGYSITAGRAVLRGAARMGVPADEILEACWQRARSQGGDPVFLDMMQGGFTGVVATLACGAGPVLALRFDMDALDLEESRAETHRPTREGFASINAGVMHACGHDGHVAVGLGVAHVLATLKSRLHGTLKLIFQPAEEGVRGAKAMVEAGVLDDVDFLVGHHLYSGWSLGDVAPGLGHYLATTKFDAYLVGEPAHAGSDPQGGRNALLAAATAALNLHALPRHRQGATRINVGRLVAGSSRNVIPANAHMVIETRGATTELNESMYVASVQVLEAAAAIYGCDLEIVQMGSAQSANSTPALAERVTRIAQTLEDTVSIRKQDGSGGSEDFTYMMRRVQGQGGQATNIGIGARAAGGGQHTSTFDFDEDALTLAVGLLCSVVLDVVSY